jgi:hypothetical protein
VGLSAHARANGLNVRQLHDAVTGLRKRSLVPAIERPHRGVSSASVAMKVVGPSTPFNLALLGSSGQSTACAIDDSGQVRCSPI